MHNVKPLDFVTRDEIRDMAQAAAARQERENPFEAGTPNHNHWEHDYLQFERELCTTE